MAPACYDPSVPISITYCKYCTWFVHDMGFLTCNYCSIKVIHFGAGKCSTKKIRWCLDCPVKLDVWLAGPWHLQVLQDPNSWGVYGDFVFFCWGKLFWRTIDTGNGYIKFGFLTVGTLAPPSPRSAQKRHSKTSVLFLCIHNCPDHRCDNLHLGHHQSREQKWESSMPMTDVREK